MGVRQMPFRNCTDAFSPEVIEVMTAAFNTAVKSSRNNLTDTERTEMAQGILERAAGGVVDIGDLTRIALSQLAHFEVARAARR
jgi:hypothetical protein